MHIVVTWSQRNSLKSVYRTEKPPTKDNLTVKVIHLVAENALIAPLVRLLFKIKFKKRVEQNRRLERQQFTKLGRKYQHD